MVAMDASILVPDALWEAIDPLLPKEPPKPKGGRPRVPDRAVLGGIIFALRTGCPWRLLPKALGGGSGTTCWRRLRDWQAAGVWQRLHETLLNWLGDEPVIDWSRSSVDSLSVRAKRGASRPAPILPTAASPAPSTTWWWTETASRWRPTSPPRTPTTRRNCFPWLTPFHPLSAPEGCRDDRASARRSSTPTRPTTPQRYVTPCAPGASPRGSPAAASTPPSDWGGTAGWWNGVLRGSSVAVA
jgi:transposase